MHKLVFWKVFIQPTSWTHFIHLQLKKKVSQCFNLFVDTFHATHNQDSRRAHIKHSRSINCCYTKAIFIWRRASILVTKKKLPKYIKTVMFFFLQTLINPRSVSSQNGIHKFLPLVNVSKVWIVAHQMKRRDQICFLFSDE